MAEDRDANVYIVEAVEMSSDTDTEDLMDDVADLDALGESVKDASHLDNLMESTHKKSQKQANSGEDSKKKVEPKHVQRLEVIDDFIRNFLSKNSMTKTLNCFQKQWYDYVHNSKSQAEDVPDAYTQNEVLKDQIDELQQQLSNAIVLSDKAKATYDKLLKERDFHKMHHQRVQQDKKKLNQNIEKLSALQTEYNNKYEELNEKYNLCMKQKMLLKIERDKLKQETNRKDETTPLPPVSGKTSDIPTGTKTKFTPFPEEDTHTQAQRNIDAFNYKQTVMSKTQKGHIMPVCTVVFHHKKPIVGTGSDDMTWKIWTVAQSEQIMVGIGHKDWVSSMKFHPKGLHMVTGSGDSTVKVWDFNNKSCSFTFSEHRQPIWSVDLNYTGDYIATGSMDHSSRLLDINVGKCRSVYRGHADTVTAVHFQPNSNLLATASADKTISIWDIRTSLCVQTFYGHSSALTACKFACKGERMASCDSSGSVKTWDLRANKQANNFSCEKKKANCLSIDRSGTIIAVGSDEAAIYLFNDNTGERQHILRGHQQKSRVQAVEFDLNSKAIVSGGSDSTYRIWQ